MSYTAMYRKFRPTRFEDVKGQDHIVTTLKNQIKSDRIGHAYLFTGTRGTGKTSVAKLFAKAINCSDRNGEDPCMECASCRAIQSGSGMNVIEIDAASNNGVDNIRQIVEEVQYPPTEGRFKVYIIDEVHMLSIGAFNALLKTLEEPPEYVVFILATTEVHKLPITILSRCQRYDFKRISVDSIAGRINELLSIEGLEAEEDAVRYVAKTADGSMRDALSLLDQCLAFNFGKKLTYQMVLDVLGAVDSEVYSNIVRSIISCDVSTSIKLLENSIMEGRELTQFVTDLTWYLRNLLLAKTSDDISVIADMSKEAVHKLEDEARIVPAETIIRYIRVFSELTNQIRYATNKRVLTEIAIIKLCCPEMEARDDSIVPRLEKLENAVANGVAVGAPVPSEALAQRAPEAPAKQAPLPKSVPDDVKQVVMNWRRIVAEVDISHRGFLKDAKPSLGAEGELLLVFSREACRAHFETTEETTKDHAIENMKDLTDTIGAISGKEIVVKTELAADKKHYEADYPNLLKMFEGIPVTEFDDNE